MWRPEQFHSGGQEDRMAINGHLRVFVCKSFQSPSETLVNIAVGLQGHFPYFIKSSVWIKDNIFLQAHPI